MAEWLPGRYSFQKIRFTIWAIPCIMVSSVLWRRSEAAVTRRTRNAFIGSPRYEGSNPSVSAGKPLRNQGLFLFVLHIFQVYSVYLWQRCFSASVREMRYVEYYFGTSFSYLKREFGNC